VRINKFLAACELGSRRKVEELVTTGRVAVNGKIVRDLSTQILETDTVTVDGATVLQNEETVYIIMNKPAKTITAVTDIVGEKFKNPRRTVLDVLFENLPPNMPRPRVFPIGRLDYDTEGLLLLTNDGNFAESVTHPSKKIEKQYVATLDRDFSRPDLQKLENGIIIDGEKTHPARAQIISKNVVELTITQGRNRQVRKMFEAIGYVVTHLKRVRIGQITLGNLRVGQFKILNTRPSI
jgi:23S rRNA pseudouridine2605 synthase